MPVVRILDDETVAKIAAGEVVERPASVVKELVENSIDAEATRISVEFSDGGKSSITVADNGCGMERADAVLSLARHATSKLRRISDLEKLLTLGFRGEALASIAAVAGIRILTRKKGDISGTEVVSEGGKPAKIRDAGCPEGTSVTVTGIFSTTPARMKHLRSDRVEGAHIADIVSRYALARPGIAFTLVRDGSPALATPGTGRLEDAISSVYGRDAAKGLIPVNAKSHRWKISGLLGSPGYGRGAAEDQTVLVNGRYVRSPAVSGALREGFGDLLPKGRHPFAVINIEIDPAQTDFNIHPAKREIKFADELEIYRDVMEAARRALKEAGAALTPQLALGSGRQRPIEIPAQPARPPARQSRLVAETAVLGGAGGRAGDMPRGGGPDARLPIPNGQGAKAGGKPLAAGNVRERAQETTAGPAHPKILGLAHGTYAIIETGDGVLIMDQHAAHERVLYEDVQGYLQKGVCDRQELISPVSIELTARESAILLEYLEFLGSIGFIIEEFGKNAFTVRAVPAVASGSEEKPFIQDVVDDLLHDAKTKGERVAQDRILKIVAKRAASAACRRAVKAGDESERAMLLAIYRRLMAAKNPHTCPHGRPTLISLSRGELERRFGRA